MLTTKRTAKKTVARSRLRSTIEPPPKELPPPPMPKAPERPASFPECSRIRKIRMPADDHLDDGQDVYTRGSVARCAQSALRRGGDASYGAKSATEWLVTASRCMLR